MAKVNFCQQAHPLPCPEDLVPWKPLEGRDGGKHAASHSEVKAPAVSRRLCHMLGRYKVFLSRNMAVA